MTDTYQQTEAQLRERIAALTAELAAMRLEAERQGVAALTAECDALRDTIALHEVGSAYAHRLAVLLECALLDPTGTWGDAHALLDEYRAACRAVNPEPPTFMGEPVVDAARKETP